jgi:PTS system fructose-specific IIC component
VALIAGVLVSGFLVVAFKRFIAPKELAQAEATAAAASA